MGVAGLLKQSRVRVAAYVRRPGIPASSPFARRLVLAWHGRGATKARLLSSPSPPCGQGRRQNNVSSRSHRHFSPLKFPAKEARQLARRCDSACVQLECSCGYYACSSFLRRSQASVAILCLASHSAPCMTRTRLPHSTNARDSACCKRASCAYLIGRIDTCYEPRHSIGGFQRHWTLRDDSGPHGRPLQPKAASECRKPVLPRHVQTVPSPTPWKSEAVLSSGCLPVPSCRSA